MPPSRRVVIVASPGVQALDIVGPHEVFAGASTLVGRAAGPRAPDDYRRRFTHQRHQRHQREDHAS